MSKEEFLQRLRQALAGEVPQSVIQENLLYYDEYIRGEVGKGLDEEEVTGEIGDPRLIAKTIMDSTAGLEGNASYENHSSRGAYGGGYQDRPDGPDSNFGLSKWFGKFLAILVVVLVVVTVFSVIAGLFRLLIPLLGPILILLFLISLFRNHMRR